MTDALGLEYVVLRCADLERSRSFYEAIGLHMVPEQHGRGARHYSCAVGAVVLELYPLREVPSRGVRLGLRVANVDSMVEALREIGAEIARLDSKDDERIAVVRDPDGHEIALRQIKNTDGAPE